MERPKFVFRLLIVEDNLERIHLFQSWLPSEVRTVVATSAGKAIGLVQRDRGSIYAGILLDHDLVEQVVTDSDSRFSGSHVAEAIIKNICPYPCAFHELRTSERND